MDKLYPKVFEKKAFSISNAVEHGLKYIKDNNKIIGAMAGSTLLGTGIGYGIAKKPSFLQMPQQPMYPVQQPPLMYPSVLQNNPYQPYGDEEYLSSDNQQY